MNLLHTTECSTTYYFIPICLLAAGRALICGWLKCNMHKERKSKRNSLMQSENVVVASVTSAAAVIT